MYHWSVLATSLAYRAAARAADFLLPLARGVSPKLRAGDLARRGAVARWRAWAAHRDQARPLLWVHAPSVGEGLQAEAVLTLLRARHPAWQIVYTFFSPSAEALAARQPADRADYLPYDTAPNVDALLAAIAPTALVFTKLDLWPELATRAAARGVRVGLIAGTVSPVSGRQHPVARRLTRPGYAAIEQAGAISSADAARLAALGVATERITVTGDPRFDSARARILALPAAWPLGRLTADAPTLVAGSTWAPDEAVLMAAWQDVSSRFPATRLLLVPHEPAPAHLARLAALIERTGGRYHPLSRLTDDAPVPALVVVDRVGVLAGLYRGAAMAYVGGGFGRAGLHSVLEPAACGLPVLFGPHWQSSREAGLLLDAGAGRALPRGLAAASRRLAESWSDWLSRPQERENAGRAAALIVEQELGAAERNADLVETLMTPAGHRTATR